MLIFQHKLALNKSDWFVHFFFFHRCCCNVLGSQNVHPSTEAYISRTLFVSSVIYNKPNCRCIVRFKLNRVPSACRTGRFFPRATPNIYIYIYKTLDHKTNLKSLGYICSNSQKYIVRVKIIKFSFMPKIIRILIKDHVPWRYFVNFLP